MLGEPEIVFTLAAGQNQPLVDLAETIVAALSARQVNARVAVDECLDPRPGVVPVLLSPYEYVQYARFTPPPEVLESCIGISFERPGSNTFAASVELGGALGALLEVHPRAIRAYRRSDIVATPLPLGHSPSWDRFATAADRDIDVLFIGSRSDRRDRALAACADSFERFKVHLQISDGSRPMRAGQADFVGGEEKRALLARSKVLLTIHDDDQPDLEWLAVAEAVCAGAMVVSEHASDIGPLVAGEHLVMGSVDRLGFLCTWAAENPSDRRRIAAAAYELLRRERPIDAIVKIVLSAAAGISARLKSASAPATRIALLNARHDRPTEELHPPPSRHNEFEGRALRALKSQATAIIELRRQLDATALRALAPDGDPTATTVTCESPVWSRPGPRQVTVIIPLYNHARLVGRALDSLACSQHLGFEVVVVDDGSTDHGGRVVERWIGEHPEPAVRLVTHPVNRGLAHARNTGIEYSRTDLLLMLDADNELRPTAIGRLLAALEADPGADFAYGILDRFDSAGPTGLASQFPWEPTRLRGGNYIDSLALIRRAVLDRLGGYSTDARLALGWEDYDLWARIAESGGHAAFVREIIARYHVGISSLVSVTDISTTDAFAAVVEHAPRLMRGLRVPV
ncbi:MAG: glycosyltransferase family A protein [Solirubrobacteraceae bacterium]